MRTVTGGIFTALSTVFFGVRSTVRKVGHTITSHPAGILGILGVGLGIFAFGHSVSAQGDMLQNLSKIATEGPQAWVGFVIILINALLYQIVDLLVALNIMITDLLISIVQFNTFVSARPVDIGWPLVRDVVNMFFIVVLLVIAFSTIIGYDKFHYKNYLPKLLLMAVLINFSKTLVGLMIDFSQVITLTFVNGFKQAAFGNFAKAFNYDKIVNTTESIESLADSADADKLLSLGNIMVTLLFAIAVMSIVATVLTIMVIYFAARIVLLWILLIFSPIAFFALALPDKMKNALGPAASNWWRQLGSLLTGGPVVAFFLWLTLATIQGASQPFEGIYRGPTSEEEAKVVQVGLSEAGTAGNMATFVVAIIMLLTGLKTAVDVSKEAAPQLGNIAQKIKSSGGPATWAARGAYKAGRATARAGAKVAVAGGQLALAKYGGKAGGSLIKSGQARAAQGGSLNRMVGTAMGRAGSTLKAYDAKRKAGVESKLEGRIKHLAPEDRMRQLDIERKGGGGVFANADMANAANMKYGEALSSGSGMKIRQKELEGTYLKNRPDDADGAKAWAAGQVKREAGGALEEAIKAAEASGKGDLVEKLKGVREKDPSLHNNFGDLAKFAANSTDDHVAMFKGLKTEAWQDSATFLAMMKAVDLVNSNGTMKDGYEDSDAWKELTKNGGNRAQYVRAHAKYMESQTGQAAASEQLAAMADGASPEVLAAAEKARYNASVQGNQMMYANVAQAGGGGIQRMSMEQLQQPTRVENFDELAAKISQAEKANLQQALQAVGLNQDSIDRFSKRFDRPITTEQATHVRQNAVMYAQPPAAGAASPAQVETAMRGQALGIHSPATMQKQVIELALMGAASPSIQDRVQSASVISNIDVKSFEGDPDVKRAVVEAMEGRLDELGKAFKTASASGDSQQLKNMEAVIRSVAKAGQEAQVKAVTSELSDIEAKLAQLNENIQKDKVLKKVTERKNRGKKS